MNYTIAEDFELPSKGKVYGENVKSTFKIRSMTTEDEMRRTSASETPYKLMCDIIENCLIEKPGINVYDMHIGDYQFLLHKLRVVTYGSDYKMLVRCPICNNMFETTFNLDSLNVSTYNEEFEKYRVIDLPVSKKKVELTYMTPRLQDKIITRTKEIMEKSKGTSNNPTYLLTLMSTIKSVDDKQLSPVELEMFVKNLPMKDTNILLQTANKLNEKVGIDIIAQVHCNTCGNDIKTPFRITQEFFGPSIY